MILTMPRPRGNLLSARPRFIVRAELEPGYDSPNQRQGWEPIDEPDDASELDDFTMPGDDDDSQWDVFLPDDEPFGPLPEPGDFWIDAEE
jgi:hypothetical protein